MGIGDDIARPFSSPFEIPMIDELLAASLINQMLQSHMYRDCT